MFQAHLIIDSHTVSKYATKVKLLHMTLWIRTEAAKAEVVQLRAKIYRTSGTLLPVEYNKTAERLELLLKLLRYHDVDTSQK